MNVMLRGLVAIAAVSLLALPALAGVGSPYGMVLHMSAADYGGCSGTTRPNDSTITCDLIDVVGDDAGNPFGQFVWVLAFGWNNIDFPSETGAVTGWNTPDIIGSAQFGITFEPGVTVGGWSLCTGGSEIQQAGWPAAGTGNIVTWAAGAYVQPNLWATIGFFSTTAGSVGRMTIIHDPRLVGVEKILLISGAANSQEFALTRSQAGSSVSVDGGNLDDGRKVCSEPVPTVEKTWGSIKSIYSN